MTELQARVLRLTCKTRGCWNWNGQKDQDGYGIIKVNGKRKKAHRASFEAFIGDIPDGALICHSCDNPSCVRPDHLFPGTITTNHNDMCAKGRQSRGQDHYATALTEEDVREIRRSACSCRSLARHYSMSASGICQIKNRQTWKHVA